MKVNSKLLGLAPFVTMVTIMTSVGCGSDEIESKNTALEEASQDMSQSTSTGIIVDMSQGALDLTTGQDLSSPMECPAERSLRCSGVCFDGQNDPDKCGGCNTTCKIGQACVQGQCAKATDCRTQGCPKNAWCDEGDRMCKPLCDAQDACATDQVCATQSGHCSCGEGFVWCETKCCVVADPASHVVLEATGELRSLSMRLDRRDRPHMTYQNIGDGARLDYSMWEGMWKSTTIDDQRGVGIDNDLAVDDAYQVHVAYLDALNKDLKYAIKQRGQWQHAAISSSGPVGEQAKIALDSKQRPHIIHVDQARPDAPGIDHTLWTGEKWVEGPEILFLARSGSDISLSDINMTMDPQDNMHVGYATVTDSVELASLLYVPPNYRYLPFTLKQGLNSVGGRHNDLSFNRASQGGWVFQDIQEKSVYYTTYVGEGKWSSPQVIDAKDARGAHASLALDQEGRPHAVYFSETTGFLHYATPSGPLWQVQTLDDQGPVGTDVEIAIDSNGQPHVAYIHTDAQGKSTLLYTFWNGETWVKK